MAGEAQSDRAHGIGYRNANLHHRVLARSVVAYHDI